MRKLEHDRPGVNWTLERTADLLSGTRGKLIEWNGGWGPERRGVIVLEFNSANELIEKLTKYAGEKDGTGEDGDSAGVDAEA